MPKRANGEGTISQRKDGRWWARITLPDGRRKAYYGPTRQAVAQQLARALHERQQGLPIAGERQTVGQYLTWWLAERVRPTVRPRTYASYAQLVRLHLGPALGTIPLARLAPQQVQAFLNAKRDAGLSPRTVQYLHAVLRRALGQALKWGLVARNVATLVEPPRVRRAPVQPLTVEEARALLAAVRGDRLEALYAVAVALGLRQGEALGLRWQDIDLDAGTLRVTGALQRVEGTLRRDAPKTPQSRRLLYLPPSLVATLRAHRARQAEERLRAGPLWQPPAWAPDLVFTTATGGALDARNVVRHYHRLLERAGLPRRPFHHLRHTAASLLLAQGVPLRVVMETLGHSHISLTADLYAHVLPALQQEAAARMEAVLRGP